MMQFPQVRPAVRPAVRDALTPDITTPQTVIAGLFAQGQQGFWLPFTDFASLSQDSAGTLPYTALEQPVGRVLDRSGRGNNASQVTSTARGVVSARVNLLGNSEFAGNSGVSAGANYSYSTLSGYLGAVRFALHPSDGYAYKSGSPAVGLTCVFSVVVKMDDGSTPLTASQGVGSDFMLVVSGNPVQAASTVPLGGGLYRLTTAPILITSGNIGIVKYSANSAKSFTVTAYSLVPVAQASLPYQRVTTATDYDSVGFPKSLRVEVDDFYTCGGGGSTTGFYFSDVIRPMGGAGTRRVIWSDRSGNNGYELAINASDKLELSAGNGAAITTVASTVSAAVAEGKRYEVMDDGAVLSVQIDGSAPVTVARPVVTAGSSTITLYRGASTGYFNGQITEPIYRAGPPPSAYERGVIRNYQMQKAGL